MDPSTIGIAITIGAGILGMFFRIEHRLTKVETAIDYIREHLQGCPQPSEENTK